MSVETSAEVQVTTEQAVELAQKIPTVFIVVLTQLGRFNSLSLHQITLIFEHLIPEEYFEMGRTVMGDRELLTAFARELERRLRKAGEQFAWLSAEDVGECTVKPSTYSTESWTMKPAFARAWKPEIAESSWRETLRSLG